MKLTEKFEDACQQIKLRDGIKPYHYNFTGTKKKDAAVMLKTNYRNVAKKHLYFEQSNNNNAYLFSWQQVTDACKLADIIVTDVVKKFC